MKLLLYSRDFSPSIGGVQSIVASLARGLVEFREPASGGKAIDLTVVTETPASGAAGPSFPFPVVRRPGFWTLAALIRQADVVHLAGPAIAPLACSLLLGKPVVAEHHGFQAICPNGQLLYQPEQRTCPGHFMAKHYGKCFACNRAETGVARSVRMLLLTPLRRWLSNRAVVNIMPTHWLASELRLKREKVVVHGIGSCTPNSPPADAKASRSTFAYQGRLVSTKGVRVLLQAFEELSKEGRAIRLLVIGSGPDEKSLRVAAAKFAGRVQFLGEVPDCSLDQSLAEAATVVMPSLAGEVFGLVAAENMRRGKLLIVSDLGSLREIVGETGLVFPAGDASALARCMRVAMDDVPHATGLADAARARAENLFDNDRMVREHISLYRETLQMKERGHGRAARIAE